MPSNSANPTKTKNKAIELIEKSIDALNLNSNRIVSNERANLVNQLESEGFPILSEIVEGFELDRYRENHQPQIYVCLLRKYISLFEEMEFGN
ncbi:hypothetical protein XBP1_390009 [Xenorhabdus bovienii str. puntauvense]|uniref:Uncharacterized protein n=1 Tax=Xenorhabdus bovienii str. puntauvense TaxID=1398201 RepID=A0A077N8Q9_XENBV|nr:hypothetical protein [Xenorhabdus bovienii]CDG98591.1 hypothetical protein XBP1_390009 [Xenorhabdus bovienii str. puntauvense]